jgi:Contractile injection system tube protein
MRIPDEHKAKLFKVDQANPGNEPGATSADAVLVQFNPTSLSYSVQNTLEKKGRDANAKQFVAQTTAKLEFDLVFDSTHDGGDVRGETDRIKQFLNPGDKSTNKDQAPALVGFRWGTYLFKGILESFKENLDFFSAEGVPLRSTLKIGLSSQDPKDVFAQLPAGHPDAAASAAPAAWRRRAATPLPAAPWRPATASRACATRAPGWPRWPAAVCSSRLRRGSLQGRLRVWVSALVWVWGHRRARAWAWEPAACRRLPASPAPGPQRAHRH